MKKLNRILLITLFLFSSSLYAASITGLVTVQPIVGFEKVHKFTPTEHTKTRMFYGARAFLGPSLMALEAEVTQSHDDEFYSDLNLKIKEESQVGKLGLRSSFNLILLRFYLRAGGQARKNSITKIQDGVSTKVKPSIRISPYAGAGLAFNLMGNIFFSVGSTVIFSGKPNGSDKEVQTTGGIGMRF